MADIIFVSLGMVVLDEIRFPDGKVLCNVPGGSGLYSTLGARLAAKDATTSERIGCLVLAGSDFPDTVAETLRDWGITLRLQQVADRLSTRGLLQYQGINFKDQVFKYTTTPLQHTTADLADHPRILGSLAFYFLASPQDLEVSVSLLQVLRHHNSVPAQPLLVWEPAPASCRTELRNEHLRAAKLVDVYSPNHTELLAAFQLGNATPTIFDCNIIEDLALQILESGVGPDGQGAVVIRCGEHGSLAVSQSYSARWFPAFYDSTSSKVIDATGAGNSFLGALTVKLVEGAGLTEAVIMGLVAASFSIEQIGLPERAVTDGTETWNGVGVSSRVEEYQAKMKRLIGK
ncbi:Ribokinase-like protein [Apiosordaria backusii]|uniref:Ribokinase-like protein n=1 Tax=Apiosordaria backusii TaxID=314023 RepID=A0AA40BN23_9PEZI|nr:Ribokinase-like protein [Apiosordaria backusii]